MELRIGSFNIQKFGANSQKDFEKIADIIMGEKLSVVALQEIFSEGKGVNKMLEQCVNYGLYEWDCCFASPGESVDSEKLKDMLTNSTRGEGYAYLWNTNDFELLEYTKMGQSRIFEPRIINSMGNDVHSNVNYFARTPYYIRLQPKYGGFFELRLINIHIYFGSNKLTDVLKRKLEYDMLVKDIYPEISQKRYGQNRTAYTVAMGDYNLNIFSPDVKTQTRNAYLDSAYTYSDGKTDINILTVQKELTTLEKKNDQDDQYANNFDHFTFSLDTSPFNRVSYKRIDAVNKYCNGDYEYYKKKISDHLPIMLTIDV